MRLQIQLDSSQKYQTFKTIGASGAWWAQVVGGWPQETRAQIMQLLYGKTEGIGMDTYRYNVGGGSKESGKGNYPNKNRRASSFLREDGTYDWSRDEQAVWCLKEAVRLGAEDIVLFANSPPERWTITGMAQGKIPFRANLQKKHEADFTRYLLDVTEHFLEQGIPVRYVSPINEPFGPWIAQAGQEGCHYHPVGVTRLMRLFAEEMNKRPALKNVQLSGAENNDLRLMNKTYTRAVLDDPAIRARLDGVDVHGYIFKPLECLDGRKVRQRYRNYMDKRYPGVPLMMSEWTHMQGGRDKGMDSALEMAKTMLDDITILNVVSWQHWIAVSEVDFCDGLLYINEDDKTFETTKRLYATGNFSRFIQGGAVRIHAQCPHPDVQVAAFEKEGKTILIAVNHAAHELEVALAEGVPHAEQYITDEARDLACAPVTGNAAILPAKSVSTFVFSA